MNPYFSTARVRKQEPLIQSLVDKLCTRLQACRNNQTPINIQNPFTCFTTDVVSEYTMGTGFHYLDEPDFLPSWTETVSGTAKNGVYIKAFPWISLVLGIMPRWIISHIYQGMEMLLRFQRLSNRLVHSIIDEQKNEGYENLKSKFSQPTFFHDILNSDLPPEEKTPGRLAEEVQVVIGAGTETVSKMLTWTTYYLLENPEKMDKLKEELERLDPERTATLIDFEKMPYLVGF